MSQQLAGKVALITGAANGIGLASARAFAEAGAKVLLADIDDDAGAAAVAALVSDGYDVSYVRCDVSIDADAAAMVAVAIERYGRLDVAFNNAGTEGVSAPTHLCSEENWHRTIAINLGGVWNCMRHEIPAMLETGGGSIINCASIAGLVGFAASPAYVASKHGVVGLTKTAALDYAGQGIRVNAVCPGVIDTQMVQRAIAGMPELEGMLVAGEPIGRLGQPEEIAAAALWLASSEASFVTGHAMPVDGGWVAQ